MSEIDTSVLEKSRLRLEARIEQFTELHAKSEIDFNEFVRAIALMESQIVNIDVQLLHIDLAIKAQERMAKGLVAPLH